MKQVSPELLEHLHKATEFYMCDLYEITLKSGLVLRYASYDRDITLPDGRVFVCDGPLLKRTRIKLTSGISVDSDLTDLVGGVPMIQVAHNGGFDEARLSLLLCFMTTGTIGSGNMMMTFIENEDKLEDETDLVTSSALSIVGYVERFGGYVNVDAGGGMEMKWVVKSSVQKLNVEYPPRKFYPTCPYALYDNACGLDLAAYTVTGTVTAVVSSQELNTTLSHNDGYFEQGGLEFTSGALSGVAVPVNTSYKVNGKIVALIPFDVPPAAGDTFKIYPGCDKTPNTCKNKFNNFIHNRATPYIPLKETII